ncbi:MAG: site-specific integrase [Desulfomonilaceae bacterium]|jgi:integrase
MPTEKQRIPGLILRGKTWWIDKKVSGKRICESCRTGDYEEAVKYFCFKVDQLRQFQIYGVRPKRTFREAAIRYLNESSKSSIAEDARVIKKMDKWVGDLNIDEIHMGKLQPYIECERNRGLKNRTINGGIQVVRHVLNLCANEWLDENGQTWLAHAPKIKLIPEVDRRSPYPLDWSEQIRIFNELPVHLRDMCLFNVNTGTREAEVCGLMWDWEVDVEELNTSVFIIPDYKVKNRDDRLVVLNSEAKAIIEKRRGVHPTHVFTYQGHPVKKMNTKAWRRARDKVGIPEARVHDLKHTYGRRLRAVGVDLETRMDLLGHRSGKITTHYSAPELEALIAASEKVCRDNSRKSHAIVILKSRLKRAVNG